MNIYVEEFIFGIISAMILYGLIPFFIFLFFTIVQKSRRGKRHKKIMSKNIKIYETLCNYMVTTFSVFALFGAFVFGTGKSIIAAKNQILIKATNNGLNVATKEFLSQIRPINGIIIVVIVIGIISLLLILIFRIKDFYKIKSGWNKNITKEYLTEGYKNVLKEDFTEKLNTSTLHFFISSNEKKLKNTIDKLETKSNLQLNDLKKLYYRLSYNLFALDSISFFYGLAKRKKIIEYSYQSSVEILQNSLT